MYREYGFEKNDLVLKQHQGYSIVYRKSYISLVNSLGNDRSLCFAVPILKKKGNPVEQYAKYIDKLSSTIDVTFSRFLISQGKYLVNFEQITDPGLRSRDTISMEFRGQLIVKDHQGDYNVVDPITDQRYHPSLLLTEPAKYEAFEALPAEEKVRKLQGIIFDIQRGESFLPPVNNAITKITATSSISKMESSIAVQATMAEIRNYVYGMNINLAFPNLSGDAKRFIETGISDNEWQNLGKELKDFFVDKLNTGQVEDNFIVMEESQKRKGNSLG